MISCRSSQQPVDEGRPDRQLCSGEGERLARKRFLDAVHFIEHLARLDLRHVVLGIALAVAHAHFGGLLRDGLVREDADPDAAATLDVTGHRPSRGLDLARREAATTDGFQAEFAEADLGADRGHALVPALLLLAVFTSSWLQHFSLLRACARASALQAPVQA